MKTCQDWHGESWATQQQNFNFFSLFLQVNSNQWNGLQETEWSANSIVALIQWIPKLTKTTMPSVLRQKLVSRMLQEPLDVTSSALTQMDESQLEELVQWSDMIVFDYLTGNYDRVASMQVIFDFLKIIDLARVSVL